jgi:hypothetical protein
MSSLCDKKLDKFGAEMSQVCRKIMLYLMYKKYDMEKKCSKCKEYKKLIDFNKHKNGKEGVHHYCKLCNSIQKKNSYDYAKIKSRSLFNNYKLTFEELEVLYLSQHGKCKICETYYDSVSKHNGLHIDHCHHTGKVRGLLCNKCNVLLGMCNDNISLLYKSIDYLKIHNNFLST